MIRSLLPPDFSLSLSIQATILDDTLNVLVGDSNGYLHCSRAVAQNCSKSGSEPDKFNHNSRLFTSYYTTVCRPIRHITQSKETAVYVLLFLFAFRPEYNRGFESSAVVASGDSCLICTRDLKAPDSQGVIFVSYLIILLVMINFYLN